ncbi:hypothetical protein BEP19_14620 [Ammoniphilus oxalaticus]|uniref:Proline reductase n=1 Tax=Ammoniphilus oxalaticus TaxID=66863 RepID=A0A419SEW5_9BACL|nr:glycine/sarcosine/betaine reductase selenoprotein B family protein [Ammoniphilus oxalaticus]RKD21841.1 hypothetical protein BEP19_14620 [Ammoniphilus oxalaticus]
MLLLKQRLIGKYAQTQVEEVETAPQIAEWDKSIEAARVVLVTTAGVHLREQPIFQVKEHDSSYRIIPGETPIEQLITSHTHFDRADADQDINCVFPLQRLRELASEGKIGSIAAHHFGLQGYVPDPTPLIEKVGPEIAEQLVVDEIDIAILSPG